MIALINWKLRLKNKATLTALVVAAVSLVYQLLAIFDVVPKVSESVVIEIVAAIVNILAVLGIVVDPTTDGIGDSERAMTYEKPYKEEDEGSEEE